MSRLKIKSNRDSVPVPILATNVGTAYAVLARARDFSLPDENSRFPERDPLDSSRTIRPGMLEFMADLLATNTSGTTRWIDVGIIPEGSADVLPMPGRFTVPAGMTVVIPMRGRALLKVDPASANGMRLMARAEASNVFRVWGSAVEMGFDRYEVQP
ncbi:MAG: hypothetical protein ACK4HW_08645 [Roseinatronobacter sp.]